MIIGFRYKIIVLGEPEKKRMEFLQHF